MNMLVKLRGMSDIKSGPEAFGEYPEGFIPVFVARLQDDIKQDCPFGRWCRLRKILMTEGEEVPGESDKREGVVEIFCGRGSLCPVDAEALGEYFDTLLPQVLQEFGIDKDEIYGEGVTELPPDTQE